MAKWISFFMNEHIWSPTDIFISGVEDMVKRVAEDYVKQGKKVRIYYEGERTKYKGVEYLHRRWFNEEEASKLIIVQESGLLDIIKRQDSIYWTAETDLKDKLTPNRLDKIKHIIGLSHYYKTLLNSEQRAKTKVVYLAPTINFNPDVTKYHDHAIYASAPERGLKELLENWKLFRGITLHVTYGIDRLPEDQRWEYLHLLAQPNIMYEGAVTERELERLYNLSGLWLYPCTGNEMFCITGQNAIRAGCVPIIYPYMALDETVRYGVRAKNIKDMAEKANELVKRPDKQLVFRQEVERAPVRHWENVADEIALLW